MTDVTLRNENGKIVGYDAGGNKVAVSFEELTTEGLDIGGNDFVDSGDVLLLALIPWGLDLNVSTSSTSYEDLTSANKDPVVDLTRFSSDMNIALALEVRIQGDTANETVFCRTKPAGLSVLTDTEVTLDGDTFGVLTSSLATVTDRSAARQFSLEGKVSDGAVTLTVNWAQIGVYLQL